MLKADFHIHTKYSMDCNTQIEDIVSRCLETEINCVNIADHDTIEGAIKLKSIAPFTVIVAEEILTPQGEIMGMFLKERIPSGISVEQAVSRIRAQGGLVCLPHPFDTFRGLKMEDAEIHALAEHVDVVELFNARSTLLRCYTRARTFAAKHGIPGMAGSDAHSADEIGSTYVEMPEFSGRDDFLEALKQGKLHNQKSSFMVHFASTMAKLRKSK
ncbi:MAG: PHP domain-containing protein [Dehalococcoidales bacterium]|nr:PHP domain-containing protein [Dehalococcoidales bacterium]